ncbi:MAG: TetR/AcrR family transcriptional regulator [Ornithinibacter sp.]
MADTVKRKIYDTTSRAGSSRARRHRILQAAGTEFVERGYLGTTMAGIAERAEVSLDTVYTLVGRKPGLFRLLVETAISGEDEAVVADQRAYVRALREEATAEGKLAIYAKAIRRIQPRLAPLLAVLQQAAGADEELARLWCEIGERRAANMRRLAEDLVAVHPLRMPLEQAADIIWATASTELYLLLVHQRGWSPSAYEQWLADTWRHTLLA